MHADPLLAFSPFGKHLICDGCHYINIYAGTPTVLVVAADADFEAFKDGLFEYIDLRVRVRVRGLGLGLGLGLGG
jgi:hypothetical protein